MKPSKADRVEEILRRIFASHLSEGTICCCDKCIEEHKLIAQAHKELDEVYKLPNMEEIEKIIMREFRFKIDLDPTVEGGIVEAMRPRFNFKKLAQAIHKRLEER